MVTAATILHEDRRLRRKTPPADKFGARRAELSEAALATLAELGYARTSLREIAQKSEFSHGVLHYYFTDKVDLICASVRQYKARCATRYDEVTQTATSREALLEGFLDKLGATLRNEAPMHRLWYDLRSQALFDPVFRDEVMQIDASLEQMVWRVANRWCALGGTEPAMTPTTLYALFDGLLQRYLMDYLWRGEPAITALLETVRLLFPALDGPGMSDKGDLRARST
jgi:AcrR family transcriptional regulator